eukprot:TRINITY_DN338_c0_g1_i2.p1 TRINITY_DN338_c0_g1~~TRINITY_DN338_c0_g1_i2.p1  ORF type:complete len:315 (-),score=41.32 TRINITY_DN338_c0_g1_i2:140-1084(-)
MFKSRENASSSTPSSPLLLVGRDFIAGSLGGISSVITAHPFDTVKVLVQNGAKFTSSMDALKYVLSQEGVKGLYRGIGAPIASVTFINSAFFGVNGQMQRILYNKEKDGELLPLYKVGIAGAVAGLTIGFVVAPRDLIKSKLQVQDIHPLPADPSRCYKNSWDCLKKIYRQNGVRGLFQGLSVTIARDVPGDMAYFFAYEYTKRYLMGKMNTPENSNHHRTPPGWVIVVSGGLAGMAFWTTIFPLDVIKTRIQTQNDFLKYKNSWDCAKFIFRNQGVRGFYRGYLATLLRSFPTSSVNFLVFESVRTLLSPYFK